MGLFDKVKQAAKDATGLGLSAQEQYRRAYEKGVFVNDYDSAVKCFRKAGEKFDEDQDTTMAQRSRANAALYSLLASKDRTALSDVVAALEAVPEIEQVGSDKEMVKTGPWVTELKAVQMETSAEGYESDADKQAAYQSASNLLMNIGTAPLAFVDKLGLTGPADRAMARAHYYGGLSDFHAAQAEILTSPPAAHDYLQKAAVQLRQAKEARAGELAGQIDALIVQWTAKRHCWVCGREMQAQDVFFRYYPATIREYNRKQVEAENGDIAMFKVADHITLCTVCGSVVEKQADRYGELHAKRVRDWAEPILAQHERNIEALHERIKALERVAHRHTN